MIKPEIGRRYKIEVNPNVTVSEHATADSAYVALQYTFKPDSFKRVRYNDLTLDMTSETATLSAGETSVDTKVFRGALVSDVKESVLTFDGEKFQMSAVSTLVHNLKQARDEKYVGEETKRLNVNSYMRTLAKKKKAAEVSSAAATVAAVENTQSIKDVTDASSYLKGDIASDNNVPSC